MGRVLVVGSVNMDVVARAERHPAVGETVLGSELRFGCGGKGANQAVAAARLGASTALVGRVGTDDFGDTLLAFLAGEGVDVARVTRAGAATGTGTGTGTALIVVDDASDNSIVVVPGANATMTISEVEGGEGDVVVAQFEIPLPVVQSALALAKQQGARTILNAAPAMPAPAGLLDLADFIVVNETELPALGTYGTRDGQVVIVTLGAEGAVALASGGKEIVRVAGRDVAAIDSTGAGDCFVGALAAALCSGFDVPGAVRFANTAASLSVQRFGAGTSMPSLAEVQEAMG